VLMRLVDGDSVTRVARQLFMSESTVKTHISRVYEKLGAHNRATALMSAIRLGVLTVKSGDRRLHQSRITPARDRRLH